MNIKEIANLSGVSSATVSRVINNSGNVKEETRQKVLNAIKKHNYIPNEIARSLSIKETSIIGVIIPDIENPFFSSVIKGIGEVAEKTGYNIMFFSTNETPSIEHSYLKIAQAQRLKGIIITPISEDDEKTKDFLVRLKNAGVSIVLVDRDINGAEFDGVYVDNVQGAYDGVRSLIDSGHSKIAIITGLLTSKPGKDRLSGYLKAMEEEGLEIRDEYIAKGDFKMDRAYLMTKKLLSLKEPPTAVFTSSNLTTLGCIRALTEMKLKIGKDISIIGFDEIDLLKDIDYKLSVVDRDAKMQGKEAMDILLSRLSGENTSSTIENRVLGYNIILRGSEKIKKTT